LPQFLFVLVTKKLLPGISFKARFHKEIFKEMIKFGLFKFVGNVTGQVVFQVDRILIGIFQPIAAITYYSVALSLVQKGFTALINVTTAVFPAISSASGIKDYDRIRDLYLRMTKFIIFLMLPVSTVLVIFSHQLLLVWQRDSVIAANSSPVLQILAIAYFIAALSGPAVTVTEAMGKSKLSATFSTISAAINFIAAITLIPRFGIKGAALAMLINFLAQVPIFIYIANKTIINISSIEMMVKTYIRPTIATILATSIALLSISTIQKELWQLLIGFSVFGVVYLLANLLVGTFDHRDKQMAIHFLSRFKK
jgi:O-antigen/teichoic acid export membrane protein